MPVRRKFRANLVESCFRLLLKTTADFILVAHRGEKAICLIKERELPAVHCLLKPRRRIEVIAHHVDGRTGRVVSVIEKVLHHIRISLREGERETDELHLWIEVV